MSSVDKGFEAFDVSREVQAVTVVDGPTLGIFRAGMIIPRCHVFMVNPAFLRKNNN